MTIVLILGLIMNAIALPLAGRRVWFLYRVTMSGQPAPDRVQGVLGQLGAAIKRQVVEVFGQKKLLKWTVPGTAHFFVFWAFVILASVYFEAYAVLLSRNPDWNWFIFGNWAVLGFAQDFIAVMCFLGIIAFWWIRMKNSPEKLGRGSRFKGSHLTGAYFVLFMIFNVLWTLFLFRGAVEAHDQGQGYGYGKAAFVSYALGQVLPDSTWLIGIGLLLHIGVMLVFLIDVLHSKHLHIFVAPLNVLFGRRPVALGAIKPMTSHGQPVNFEDLEDMDEDMQLGVGKVEDFTWKGILDFQSCTECGRCQSQCPAWNTDKPLSPKLLIMNLRDNAMRKAPYLLADPSDRDGLPAAVLAEVERPLVGETEGDPSMPTGGAVIDNDVLWSCTSCGACVNQCPVDIEHVDHIMDMRRHQVLVESNFPAELNGLFKGLESKGNPWNMSASARMEWAQGLEPAVRVVGGDGPDDPEDLSQVDWLFWVGCAGAYEDRAKKTTRAVAELLNMAGVDFAVLGNGETCTGDPARRAGNEFIFQGLASQNAETFKEHKAKKVVATCAHCFNTLKNEYGQFGVELEVVHHTQLLNRLVREKKLTPVAVPGGANGSGRSITYHDPCYLGRHNQVYSPPRELLEVIPDATFTEMPRSGERSFCCGAGGARMWMEENIGERINVNRTREAVATGADQIAVGCPFCRVMLADGLVAEQQNGNAREEVEVLDVAQLLLASVKGEAPTKAKVASGSGMSAAGGATAVETKDEPETGDVTQTGSTVTETSDVGPSAKASGGSSLFDDGGSLFGQEPPAGTPARETAQPQAGAPTAAEEARAPEEKSGSLFDQGGSLFDTPAQAEQPEAQAASAGASEARDAEAPVPPEDATAAEPPAPGQASAGAPELGSGGSLFDIETPSEPEATAAPEAPTGPAAEAKAEPEPQTTGPSGSIPEGSSLFDIKEAVEAKPQGAPAAETPTPAAADAGEPEAEGPAAEEPEDEEPAAEEPGKSKPSGEPHRPKTDADIGEGSLFDL
ncbi:MAG TPA: heterodisulfide reductase-related iron-sulfur binding cluster [Marmoricola sp.]|nr:heterodisulfide reductase-related iron-sulfur binding cluster [Marmoricola sp.]